MTPQFFRTADAFRARRYEGPRRFAQKRPRSFVSALRSIAMAGSANNQLCEIFGVVQFSTFATLSAQSRRAEGQPGCLLPRVMRTSLSPAHSGFMSTRPKSRWRDQGPGRHYQYPKALSVMRKIKAQAGEFQGGPQTDRPMGRASTI